MVNSGRILPEDPAALALNQQSSPGCVLRRVGTVPPDLPFARAEWTKCRFCPPSPTLVLPPDIISLVRNLFTVPRIYIM